MSIVQISAALGSVPHVVVTAAHDFKTWLAAQKPSTDPKVLAKLKTQISAAKTDAEIKTARRDWVERLKLHYGKSAELDADQVTKYVTALALTAKASMAFKPDANTEYMYIVRACRVFEEKYTWICDVFLFTWDNPQYNWVKKNAPIHEKSGYGASIVWRQDIRSKKAASIRGAVAHGFAGLAGPKIRFHDGSELLSNPKKWTMETYDSIEKSAKAGK